MSKIDNNVVNHIRMLSIDMINKRGFGDAMLSLSISPLFYTLYLNHINFVNNKNCLNRDRVVVNNRYLPTLYSTLHLFGFNVDLKSKLEGIEIGSVTNGDVIASSVGIALGGRYLDGLITNVLPKNNLISYHTYCICTMDDLMSGISYEALSFASYQKLSKLIIICNKDDIAKDSSTKETYKENLLDRFMALNFNFIEIKNGNNIAQIDDAISEAKASKKPSIIILNTKYGKDSLNEGSNKNYNKPLKAEDIKNLTEKYNVTFPIAEELKEEINKIVSKRIEKFMAKWDLFYQECINNNKTKDIINFIENKNIEIKFSGENFKLNENYNEELIIGNSKMFNMFAYKSPYVISASDDNFIYTKMNIVKYSVIDNENKIGRNILFGNRTLGMGGIANGLASLGFKIFISTPLSNCSLLLNSIKLSSKYNYPVTYVFTENDCDNFDRRLLNNIMNSITFNPGDINEIIGIYEILAKYKKCSIVIIDNKKVPKLKGAKSDYVMAGAYRIKKEKEKLDGTIIVSGKNVSLGLELSQELEERGFNLRVVSLVSKGIFELQSDKYKDSLLNKEAPIIGISSNNNLVKYTLNENYIIDEALSKEEIIDKIIAIIKK